MTAEMMKKTGREITAEIVGSALIALSTYNVALYAEFPMAGLSGVCLILYRLFGLPMGVIIIRSLQLAELVLVSKEVPTIFPSLYTRTS